jgi:hypothetical protein
MFLKGFLIVVFVFVSSSCHRSELSHNPPDTNIQTSRKFESNSSPPTSNPQSSRIEGIDFRNFTYTGPADYDVTFTLKDGEKPWNGEEGFLLQEVEFFDVTADGEDEAIVVIFIQTGGSACPHFIFVYALDTNRPRALWTFMSGDRAEGGYKQVLSENGDLVLELFGDNRFENGEWKFDIAEGKFDGLCCPTTFTRFRFAWDKSKFVLMGQPELFDYDWKEQLINK